MEAPTQSTYNTDIQFLDSLRMKMRALKDQVFQQRGQHCLDIHTNIYKTRLISLHANTRDNTADIITSFQLMLLLSLWNLHHSMIPKCVSCSHFAVKDAPWSRKILKSIKNSLTSFHPKSDQALNKIMKILSKTLLNRFHRTIPQINPGNNLKSFQT